MVQTTINLPFITADQNGPKHLDVTLTRAKFEELTADLTDRCVQPFKNALADAKLDVSKIDEVVMVGGSTRMPVIQELVKQADRQGAQPVASTPTKSSRSARRSRPACSPAKSTTSSCSTSPRSRWVSKPSAASRRS